MQHNYLTGATVFSSNQLTKEPGDGLAATKTEYFFGFTFLFPAVCLEDSKLYHRVDISFEKDTSPRLIWIPPYKTMYTCYRILIYVKTNITEMFCLFQQSKIILQSLFILELLKTSFIYLYLLD